MAYTEVTSQSWFGRIGNSIKGILVGIVLIAVSCIALFWNEGRTFKTASDLAEGKGQVVAVAADAVDAAREKALVHVSGMTATDETLTDPDFAISVEKAVRLRREVEMFQWREKKESKTRNKLGGGTETETVYSYEKTWADNAIDSSGFKESGHDNPGAMRFPDFSTQARNVTLGAFALSSQLIGKMSWWRPVPVDPLTAGQLAEPLKSTLTVADGGYYLGANPATPAIGDHRIRFAAVDPAEVSIVGRQVGNSFESWTGSRGTSILQLERGRHSAEEMFAQAEAQNKMLGWIVRAVGFIAMWIGFGMLFAPLGVLGDVIPLFGDLLRLGTGILGFFLAAALSLVVIAVGWLAYRPLVAGGMIAGAILLLVLLQRLGKSRRPTA